MPQEIYGLPLEIKGSYSDGCSVSVKVWGASFAAFDIEAKINESDKTWSAVLNEDKLSHGKLTLTAMLFDENGIQIAMSVCTVDY